MSQDVYKLNKIHMEITQNFKLIQFYIVAAFVVSIASNFFSYVGFNSILSFYKFYIISILRLYDIYIYF